MAQDYITPIDATQGWTEGTLQMTNNEEALRSGFSGASPPASPVPVFGQRYSCTSTGGGFVAGSHYIFNGATWDEVFMVGGLPIGYSGILSTVPGIDGKAVASTLLLTATSRTIIDRIDIEVTAITAISANPDMGAGVAAGEDDVCESKAFSSLTVVTGVGKIFTLVGNPISRVVEIAEVLNLGIDTGAVGTTLTLTARTYGKIL